MIISLTLISFVATFNSKNDFLFAEIGPRSWWSKNTLANFQQIHRPLQMIRYWLKPSINRQTIGSYGAVPLFEDNDLFNQAAVEMTAVRANSSVYHKAKSMLQIFQLRNKTH